MSTPFWLTAAWCSYLLIQSLWLKPIHAYHRCNLWVWEGCLQVQLRVYKVQVKQFSIVHTWLWPCGSEEEFISSFTQVVTRVVPLVVGVRPWFLAGWLPGAAVKVPRRSAFLAFGSFHLPAGSGVLSLFMLQFCLCIFQMKKTHWFWSLVWLYWTKIIKDSLAKWGSLCHRP